MISLRKNFAILLPILSMLLLTVGCQQPESTDQQDIYAHEENTNSSIPVFDLDLKRYVERDFYLSEICDSLEYVFLETTEYNYIGRIDVIKVSTDYIVLTDELTKKVHAFNRQGNYLFELSKQGKGPGEYVQVDDFLIDEKNYCVYLKAGGIY